LVACNGLRRGRSCFRGTDSGILFSEDTLHDIIAALGIMIYWYYGITAFARAWYVRKELFTSLYNFLLKLTSPLLAGLIPAAVFAYLIRESMRTPGGTLARDTPALIEEE
jgi:hypothetical protein